MSKEKDESSDFPTMRLTSYLHMKSIKSIKRQEVEKITRDRKGKIITTYRRLELLGRGKLVLCFVISMTCSHCGPGLCRVPAHVGILVADRSSRFHSLGRAWRCIVLRGIAVCPCHWPRHRTFGNHRRSQIR